MLRLPRLFVGALLSVLGLIYALPGLAQNRVTILNDAFGDRPQLEQDWGYSR